MRLPNSDEQDEQVDTVVQPDLLVVCDQDKLDDKGCRGAPDWVVEVISPSTALIDLRSSAIFTRNMALRSIGLYIR